MSTIKTNVARGAAGLRIWPGVLVALIILVLRWIVPIVLPHLTIVGILAGVGGFVLILLWWLLFSRAPWQERLGALVLMVAAIAATMRTSAPSRSFQGARLKSSHHRRMSRPPAGPAITPYCM